MPPPPTGVGLRRNYALSLLTACLWYLQFFFYASATCAWAARILELGRST